MSRQVEDSESLGDRMGWTMGPYKPFIDNDISASTRSKARRPEYERLMELVATGDIDGILFYSNSRLTRRPREFEDIIELVERTGVQLASVVSGQADLSTADGRQIARILAASDAAEAERTSERVTRMFVQRRGEGKPNPSSRAFGFEKGGMKVIEEEAELIREAVDRVLNEGWSLGMIVKDWNTRQIPTVRGAGGWSRTTVSRTLLNPRTAGMISHNGEVLGRGQFEAIITEEQQKRLKASFEGRRNGSTVTFKQRQHALAGFMVCGKCGKPMKVNALYDAEGNLRRDSYIVCSRSQHGCGNVKRNYLHLLGYVDGIVRNRIEMFEPLGDGGMEDETAEQMIELKARLSEVEEDIEELQASFAAREIRFKDYNTALALLRTQQESVERAMSELDAKGQADPEIDLLATWEDGSVEEKRAVLEWCIDHIKIHPIGKVGPTRSLEMVPVTTEVVFR